MLTLKNSLIDYITEYQSKAKSDEISKISEILGLDQAKLRVLMGTNVTEANINEYGRFDDLKSTVDKAKARTYFEKQEGTTIAPFRINIKIDNLLMEFILRGGFEV
ncbi:MAG: hypothetical protein IPH28_15750 [Cytophagaceae bacterium]|nr:hypothetical protein [Cytophagaceae bacterium]